MDQARVATADDAEIVTRLWAEAVADIADLRGGRLLAASLQREDRGSVLIGDPAWRLVIGTLDDVPVGLAAAHLDRSRSVVVAVIELIYVEPAARRIGLAETMLECVYDWCRKEGATGIDAPALPGSRAAKSFFESQGFQARLLTMHGAVQPEPGEAS